MKQSGPRDLVELDRLKRSASNSLWYSHQEPPSQGALLTESWDRSAGAPVGHVDAGTERLQILHPNGLNGLVLRGG